MDCPVEKLVSAESNEQRSPSGREWSGINGKTERRKPSTEESEVLGVAIMELEEQLLLVRRNSKQYRMAFFKAC